MQIEQSVKSAVVLQTPKQGVRNVAMRIGKDVVLPKRKVLAYVPAVNNRLKTDR